MAYKNLINLRDDYIEKVVSDISISSDHQEVCNEKDPHHCNLAAVHVLCFFAEVGPINFCRGSVHYARSASMMTTSFGWTIQSSKDVNAYQISLQDFCEMYNHLTNEDNSSGLAKSSGNIKGIDPHFLQESNIHIAGESKKAVYVYEFPLEFKMPEGVHLQSIVAFTDGEICMSAIHVQLDSILIKWITA